MHMFKTDNRLMTGTRLRLKGVKAVIWLCNTPMLLLALQHLCNLRMNWHCGLGNRNERVASQMTIQA